MPIDHRPAIFADRRDYLLGSDSSEEVFDNLSQDLYLRFEDQLQSEEDVRRIFADMTLGQQLLCCMYPFHGEVTNGGIAQFFFNSSGMLKEHLWEALGLIPKLSEFRALFGGEIQRYLASQGQLEQIREHNARHPDWAHFTRFAKQLRSEDAFDSWYYKHSAKIQGLLVDYVRGHVPEFLRVCPDDAAGAEAVFRDRQPCLAAGLLEERQYPGMADSYVHRVLDINTHATGPDCGEDLAVIMGKLGLLVQSTPPDAFVAKLHRTRDGWETAIDGVNPIRIGYRDLVLVVLSSGTSEGLAALPAPPDVDDDDEPSTHLTHDEAVALISEYQAKLIQYISDAGPDMQDVMTYLLDRFERAQLWNPDEDKPPRQTSATHFVHDLVDPASATIMECLLPQLEFVMQKTGKPVSQWDLEFAFELIR
ncbi:MAG TPA: hypothetical protein DCS97_03660 [Planctomycetes bacterium]|nr:hypothetical protein [Planctomycetota bacterium]